MLCGELCVAEPVCMYDSQSCYPKAGSCSVIDHVQSTLSSHQRFIFILPLFHTITFATVLVIMSYSRDPKTRKERALCHPHKHLHHQLCPKLTVCTPLKHAHPRHPHKQRRHALGCLS